jgi:hypothetical protein
MENCVMTDIRSEEPGELLASLEVRRKALEMLRSRGRRALNDVEKMLGWERSIGMPINQLAEQLGITRDQLRYILFRNERQKEAKERRVVEKETRNVEFTAYTSSKLKFTISFPADWKVAADTLRAEEGNISLEQKAKLAQMELGLFQASPSNNENELWIEVIKLKLAKPITALELYELDKSPPEQVPTGSRPSSGVDVDGLHGVKYYYVFNTGETTNMREMPKFFNAYFAENDQGWIISCSCKAGTFNNYKPVFERIIGSFRRI